MLHIKSFICFCRFSFFTCLINLKLSQVLQFLQVLCQMASMTMEDLVNSLFESMPMGNITGCRTGELRGKPVLVGCEDGFLEAILLDAAEKMEGLVLEGLRIQMGSSTKATKYSRGKERRRQYLVLLMSIQVKDPKEDNGAVGNFLIGLIEASAAEESGRRFQIHGVHIAGMKHMKRTSGKDSSGVLQQKDATGIVTAAPCSM